MDANSAEKKTELQVNAPHSTLNLTQVWVSLTLLDLPNPNYYIFQTLTLTLTVTLTLTLTLIGESSRLSLQLGCSLTATIPLVTRH